MPTLTSVLAVDTGSQSLVGQRTILISLLQVCNRTMSYVVDKYSCTGYDTVCEHCELAYVHGPTVIVYFLHFC